ncbi:MAG TPA: hypothetical protein VF006_01455 [Longimicrobium sp.]
MKGPHDEQLAAQGIPLLETAAELEAAAAPETAVRPAPSGVPGGKALARLHQWETERSLAPSDPASGDPAPPPAAQLTVAPDEGADDEGGPGEAPAAEAAPEGEGGEEYAYDGEYDDEGARSPYLAALRQLEAMEAAAPTDMSVPVPVRWTPLGPYAIPHGQTYGSGPGSRPPVAGRISSVAVDPGNANHLLIGAAAGGVWQSKDAGATWIPRTDAQGTLATGTLAFTPGNPNIVYAGTGEGDFYSALGVGLLRSMDNGTTWGVHCTAPFVGQGFYDLLVDPLNPNHLLAGTTAQLAESGNGGATWSVRRTQRTWDLSMHPAVAGNAASTKEVFAACGDGLHRSADGGATWSPVALPGLVGSIARMEVAHAPSNGAVVFAVAATGSGIQMWRRSVFGGAFALEPAPVGVQTDQAWYDWFAAVAPNDPNTVYVGAIDVHKGVRAAAGTWSWTKISARAAGDSIHPDQHAIAFHPLNPAVVYIGNDGGIYRTPDAGATWQSLNKGLAITEVEYLAAHPQYDAWLLGGTQDNGTMRYEGSACWFHVADGDGGDCGVNASAPYTCYHTYYGMGMERSTTGGAWGSWTFIGPTPGAGHDSLFYPPMEVNGSVVAQAGTSVWISTNGGSSWTPVALPGVAGKSSALAIPTTTRVLVGTENGQCYRIDQVGGVWQAPAALAQPRPGYVSDLLVDPTNPSRYWATYSTLTGGHVYRSDTAGASWVNVSAGLPNIPANAVVVDPAATSRVYVGMDVGVFRSMDAGATWSSFSTGLPNAIVGDLLFHPVRRLVRAATRSRGVWEIPADPTAVPDVQVYLRDSMVDTARLFPSPTGGPDPFQPGAVTNWADSIDIKGESAPFQVVPPGGADFQYFEDDHGIFAAGLQNEATLGGSSRLYVQVHNRGVAPAQNTAVKLFWANGSSLPPLPAGFWTSFPNNVVPAGSPWQPVAPHVTVPQVQTGRPMVVPFGWTPPSTTPGSAWVLALVSAANDPISTAETDVTNLVRGNARASLKRFDVVPFCKVQWTGPVAASTTTQLSSTAWPAAWDVLWTVMPVSPTGVSPQIRWKVRVQRSAAQQVTYWILVTNLTPVPVTVELRCCVLKK